MDEMNNQSLCQSQKTQHSGVIRNITKCAFKVLSIASYSLLQQWQLAIMNEIALKISGIQTVQFLCGLFRKT